jgi:hypothetical protein
MRELNTSRSLGVSNPSGGQAGGDSCAGVTHWAKLAGFPVNPDTGGDPPPGRCTHAARFGRAKHSWEA